RQDPIHRPREWEHPGRNRQRRWRLEVACNPRRQLTGKSKRAQTIQIRPSKLQSKSIRKRPPCDAPGPCFALEPGVYCALITGHRSALMFKRGAMVLLIFFSTNPIVFAQELKSVRMGYPSLGFRQGHIWVAKDEGLFAKYGLDLEPVFLRGGQLAIQALAAGDPPLMSIGQVIQANLSGFNLVLIAGVESFYDSTIFGRSDTTRLEQLKGKRLGI